MRGHALGLCTKELLFGSHEHTQRAPHAPRLHAGYAFLLRARQREGPYHVKGDLGLIEGYHMSRLVDLKERKSFMASNFPNFDAVHREAFVGCVVELVLSLPLHRQCPCLVAQPITNLLWKQFERDVCECANEIKRYTMTTKKEKTAMYLRNLGPRRR